MLYYFKQRIKWLFTLNRFFNDYMNLENSDNFEIFYAINPSFIEKMKKELMKFDSIPRKAFSDENNKIARHIEIIKKLDKKDKELEKMNQKTKLWMLSSIFQKNSLKIDLYPLQDFKILKK